MFVLFTDFGLAGPYVGQMKAVLAAAHPGRPIIDLFADAPSCAPREASYLLAAYAGAVFPPGSIFICVVDPGVGGRRPAEAHLVDGRWFIGPGNGLFEMVLRRGRQCQSYRLAGDDPAASASFHGRDIFAPLAGRLAGQMSPAAAGLVAAEPERFLDRPDDLPAIIYIDHFGNLMTGLRAVALPPDALLGLAGREVRRARTFSDVPEGTAFWYENANGLAEIAVNRGRADRLFAATPGMAVQRGQ